MMMKKLIYLFSAVALLCACEKAEDFGQPNQGGTASGELPEVIYATVADNNDKSDKTRTVVAEDGKTILWNTGDAIAYIGPDALRAMYQYEGDDRVATAAFTYKETNDVPSGAVCPEIPYAVYPYSSGAYCKSVNGVNTLVVNFPAEQTYAVNSFGRDANVMVAAGENGATDDFYFRNVCGYLTIKLYGEGVSVKSIELTALGGETLSGTGYITANHDVAPVVTMGNSASAKSTVTLNCGEGVALGADAANATEFWFALPTTTFSEGFKIRVTPTTGLAFEMQTSKQVEIIRNDIQPMAALQYNPNAQAPNQLLYTRSDNSTKNPISFHAGVTQPFDANITRHYYDEGLGKFIIECDAPISEIKGQAFQDCDISSVNFPSQLTVIGNHAFSATHLTELIIPGTLTTLGNNAFSGCTALQKVTFQSSSEPLFIDGEGETYSGIEESPFYEATLQTLVLNRQLLPANDKVSMSLFRQHSELTSLTIGDEVETISDYMFASTGITSLSIPSSVTSINDGAFSLCEKLVTVDVAGKVSIGYSAFNICEKLQTVDIRGGVTSIGIGAFGSCTSLNSFSMNATQSTGEIGSSAFSGCTALTTITIPGGITRIYDKVFYDCTSLNSISFLAGSQPLTMGYIPGMVAAYTADHGPFYHCPLTSISLDRDIVMSAEYADDCDANDEGIFSYQGYMGESHQTTVTIGENVTSIPTYMFATSAVTSVTIPSTITSVGQYAFLDCEKLQSAVINANLIGSDMFESCGNLATVTIGGTLDAINVDAFSGCSKLSTLNISGSVATIGDGAFDGFNLTSLNISGHVGTIGANAFDDNDKMTSFTVTGSVGTIGASAFEDSDKLATVSITGTVDRVCSYAFSDCDAVTTLAIRANVVEAYAYEDMDGLTSATLYGATVGNGVFYDCNALQTVVIDGGVNSIGNEAFDGCSKLTSVTFEGSTTNLRLGFQDGTLSDKGPFYDSPLTYINLNRQIDYIYDNLDATDEGVFANVNTSTPATVVLGENVKAIHNWMFYGVPISTLTIPASINAIGKEAFGGNSRLTTITCKGSAPATLDSAPFPSSVTAIYVPAGAVDEYQLYWDEYYDKITRR